MKFILLLLVLINCSFSADNTLLSHNLDLSTPQNTLRSFFKAFKTWEKDGKESAPYFFDIPEEHITEYRAETTFKLKLIKQSFDRIERISYDTIPNHANSSYINLYKFESGNIALKKNAQNNFVFDQGTLRDIESIFHHLSQKEVVQGVIEVETSLALDLREWLSSYPLLLKSTLYVKNWHWLLLLPLLAISSFTYAICALFGQNLIRRIFRRKGKPISSLNLGKPLGVVLSSFTFYTLLESLLVYEDNLFFKVLTITVHVLYSYSLMWFLWQMVNWLSIILAQKAETTQSKFDDLLVPMLKTTLRILIVIVGFFLAANVFQYDISHLLAGLGIGSLAFALAAKDTIENLFGSLTVIADRPFHIGDWVIIDGVEGTVAKLGFRSTRLRTFYDSEITVPNSKLINAIVDNMGERKFRRVKTTLGVTYGTSPDKLAQFCEGIRELIRTHPYTRKDYYHVYFNSFGPYSLDIMLYCFLEAPDWAIELRERERLFLDIMRLANQTDVEFAFPTQNLLLQQQDRFDPSESQMNQTKSYAKDLGQSHFIKGQKPGQVEY